MVHDTAMDEGVEILLDCLDATRQGDNQGILDGACDRSRKSGEGCLLERARQQEVDNTRCFALYQRSNCLAAGSRLHRRTTCNEGTHLRGSIPHTESGAPGGNNPVGGTLVSPYLHCVADLLFVVGYDPELNTLVTVLLYNGLDGRARLVRGGVGRRGVADCMSGHA